MGRVAEACAGAKEWATRPSTGCAEAGVVGHGSELYGASTPSSRFAQRLDDADGGRDLVALTLTLRPTTACASWSCGCTRRRRRPSCGRAGGASGRPACRPFSRVRPIGEVEPGRPPCGARLQVLERDLRRPLRADFTAEAVQAGTTFSSESPVVIGQISGNRRGQRQLLAGDSARFCPSKSLPRIVRTAIRAPAQRRRSRSSACSRRRRLRSRLLLPVVADQVRQVQLTVKPIPIQPAARWAGPASRGQQASVADLPEGDRFGVFELLRRPEGFVVAAMSAVRAVARCRALDAGAWRDLEVAEAFLDGTLAPEISVLVDLDRNADRFEPGEVAEAEH